MSTYKFLSILAFFFISTLSYSQVVTNTTQLNNAIAAATPGTTITLADGTWNNVFIDIDKNGTTSAPITITAQTSGSVLMTGNSRVYMEGSYLTVSGLVFQNPSNLVNDGSNIEPVFELRNCDYCQVIDNKIDTYNGTESQKTMKFKWVYLTNCLHNEIAYNSFIGKYGVGSIINDNRSSANADYLKIHHNYFADRTPINGINDDNDQDAIRIGTSTTSLSDSYSEVYENYFYNFFGEIEVISNKSGENKYYNNTFRDYGGCLTLRHGNNCEVYGNYFFAENNDFTGGVRVIGEGHKVYNNYIEGINSFKPNGSSSNVTGGINVMNGRLNSALNEYYQVKNAQVINNTFVNCDYALRIGTVIGGNDQEPENLTVANNIMYNTSINPYQIVTSPSGSSVSVGNLTNLPSSDLTDDGNFHRLTSGSSPIDAGIGSYPFLTQDVLEGIRDANFDAGAEEFGANGTHLPFTAADVGTNIGFGALQSPMLTVSTSTLNFGVCGSTMTFEVDANVDWTITESLSWLSLDVTAGSGPATITATTIANATGTQRTGTISIDEIAGGSGLSTLLTAVQSNTFVPSEIPIVGTTSLGMQAIPTVAEINAYNDDFTNYWTGNPDTEAEVSITFDLGSPFVLTEIGIHFWKADERTTTFSIAIADNATGPFTTVINNGISASSGVTVNTEQLFSLSNTTGRYVKFIGIGNSSSTNWTSIANVNIYGYPDCNPSGIYEFQPIFLLEGPYQGGGIMYTQLMAEIPLNQPYSVSPYNYSGTESISNIPANMVDWVLVEARSGMPNLTGNRSTVTVETKAGILLTDGTVQGVDGNSLAFVSLNYGEAYYFCIRHRNHLDVLTANAIIASSSMSYDFTTSTTQALGTNQLKISNDGFALLHGGDFTQDGIIQTTDYDQWQFIPAILNTYTPTDGNLDGTVQTTDYDLWFENKAKIGSVEIAF